MTVVVDGLVKLRSRCSALPFGLPLGCLLLIRVGGWVGGREGRGERRVQVG